MAITTDLLNTTLADLQGPIEHTFRYHADFYAWLMKRKKVSSERGQIIERPLLGSPPARGKGIVLGTETIPGGRTEATKKIQLQTARIVVRCDIPKRELRENEGKTGVIKLMKTYVESTVEGVTMDLDRHFLAGVSQGLVFDSAELQSIQTLNGQKTFATGIIGVTNGLLDFVAPGSQTDTVQNLAKSSSYNYVNQFGQITSFALDGMRTYRKVARECAQYNMSNSNAHPDICLVDGDSFARIEESNENHVRLVSAVKDPGNTSLVEIPHSGLLFRYSKNLILTDFTGVAAQGVCYMLSADGFELVEYEGFKMGNFDDRIPNQDVVTAKGEAQFQLLCKGMRMQGVVAGGANP